MVKKKPHYVEQEEKRLTELDNQALVEHVIETATGQDFVVGDMARAELMARLKKAKFFRKRSS